MVKSSYTVRVVLTHRVTILPWYLGKVDRRSTFFCPDRPRTTQKFTLNLNHGLGKDIDKTKTLGERSC